MKFTIFSILFASFFALTACGGGENHTEGSLDTQEEVKAEKAATPDSFDATFADGMTGAVYQNYLKLRTALVKSDENNAKAAAANLADALGDDRPTIKVKAKTVANAADLAAVRTAFSELTTELEPLFTQGISDGVIYKQHCPMAFDGAGGNWFSDVSEIRNPYYGDKMLKCGKVVEEIR